MEKNGSRQGGGYAEVKAASLLRKPPAGRFPEEKTRNTALVQG